MLVSVVIPTFNRAGPVCRAIESALAQTYDGALEIVVVDDGSTDATQDVIAQRFGADERIRYYCQDNAGPAAARNRAFAMARGDYVALLDSDDVWKPWKLELQIRCMEAFPELGMTWTDMEALDPSGQVVDKTYLRTMYHAYGRFPIDEIFARSLPVRDVVPDLAHVVGDAQLRSGSIFSQMIQGNLVHTSTVVLRRERLARVKGFDESYLYSCEDYEFHLRICKEGAVGLIDLAAIQYQVQMADQLTGPRYMIYTATNSLRILQTAIERDRAAINLPAAVIQRKLASRFAWVAWEHLERGEVSPALRHLFQSLRHWPWQPKLLKTLLLCLLPRRFRVALREGYKYSKTKLGRQIAAPVGAPGSR